MNSLASWPINCCNNWVELERYSGYQWSDTGVIWLTALEAKSASYILLDWLQWPVFQPPVRFCELVWQLGRTAKHAACSKNCTTLCFASQGYETAHNMTARIIVNCDCQAIPLQTDLIMTIQQLDEELLVRSLLTKLRDPATTLSEKYRVLFSLRNLKGAPSHKALRQCKLPRLWCMEQVYLVFLPCIHTVAS